MGIDEDGCVCENREYRLYNNIYTITIHCTNCNDGYCIYENGEIRKLDHGQSYTVKEVVL